MSIDESFKRTLLIKRFLAEHPEYFDKYEAQAIDYYAKDSDLKRVYRTDLMREVCDELGFIPDDQNIYEAFIREIQQEFGIDGKTILEVGGGVLPRLARRINLKQKFGNITVYDPKLGINEKGNSRLILKRKVFKANQSIEKINLVIALMACKGAEEALDAALDNEIDFMIWLCEGGPHGDYFDFYESDEEWINSTIIHAERGVEQHKMGKLMVKRLDEFSEYPIIYNHREK